MPFIEPGMSSGSDENMDIGPISKVKVYTPAEPMSKVLSVVNTADRLSIEHGDQHLIEVTFSENKTGLSKDFRPDIPLIIHW